MALKTLILRSLQRSLSSHQRNYNVTRIIYKNPPAKVVEESNVNADVPGLSNQVLPENCTGPVGPGADKCGDYKNPEYFCYNINSYYEAEVELGKFRCPQPSNKKKN